MIKKPAILVTSIGRTGTEFFATLFANIIQNSTSLHEPDIIKIPGVKNRFVHYSQQVRRAGIWRMFFLKALGKWTLVTLSDSRFRGNLTDDQVLKLLLHQRMSFISKMSGTVYVESNLGYYGLLDIMPAAFESHRAIYIVRDGRDWVRSVLNWGEVYGKSALRELISHKWPKASDLLDDPFCEKWESLSRFEKVCWAWSRLNKYALRTLSKNRHARLYRFEQIFSGEERYQVLNDLVSFVTTIPGIVPASLDRTEGWLEQKIHMSSGNFPHWEEWEQTQKHQFEIICGPLMEELGYTV